MQAANIGQSHVQMQPKVDESLGTVIAPNRENGVTRNDQYTR